VLEPRHAGRTPRAMLNAVDARAEPGRRTLVTHVFAAGSPHLDDDEVFGVKETLIREFSEQPPGEGPAGRNVPRW
jgi:hydroxyquinol 1,2-dioxygenase